MPSTGDQSALNFKERYIYSTAVGLATSLALGANEFCDRLRVTEVGIQAYNLTGTSLALQIRQRNGLGNNVHSFGAGFTTISLAPTSHLLTGVGTSIWRPQFGEEIIANYKYNNRKIIQFQVRANEDSISDWDGIVWIKWIPYTESQGV